MEFTKKRYNQPIVEIEQYEGLVLTSSGEGDLDKDPSRDDIYTKLFLED